MIGVERQADFHIFSLLAFHKSKDTVPKIQLIKGTFC